MVEQIPRSERTDIGFVPDDYRPSTASPASRVVYGIPARPHDPAGAAYWDSR